MKNIQLKICGIVPGKTDEMITSMADMLGFIFYDRSARFVDAKTEDKIRDLKGIKKVGVFVNASKEKILSTVKKMDLSMVQLHGEESPALCRALKEEVKVIKSLPIKEEKDLELVDSYRGSVDYFLFDTKGKLKGGNGIKFNWNLLKDKSFGHPFFLSGGISREDAAVIREYDHPELAGIDINSCFEIQPGQKDLGLIEEFKKDLEDESK
jgi:phosphoribosylanthranilate isomerase